MHYPVRNVSYSWSFNWKKAQSFPDMSKISSSYQFVWQSLFYGINWNCSVMLFQTFKIIQESRFYMHACIWQKNKTTLLCEIMWQNCSVQFHKIWQPVYISHVPYIALIQLSVICNIHKRREGLGTDQLHQGKAVVKRGVINLDKWHTVPMYIY